MGHNCIRLIDCLSVEKLPRNNWDGFLRCECKSKAFSRASLVKDRTSLFSTVKTVPFEFQFGITFLHRRSSPRPVISLGDAKSLAKKNVCDTGGACICCTCIRPPCSDLPTSMLRLPRSTSIQSEECLGRPGSDSDSGLHAVV